jgi:hypothetical protein
MLNKVNFLYLQELDAGPKLPLVFEQRVPSGSACFLVPPWPERAAQ